MRLTQMLVAAAALASAGVVLAQSSTDGGVGAPVDAGVLCIDTGTEDKQPEFTRDAGLPSAIIVTDDGKLRLNTNLNVLNPEEIILPFEQDLEALIVYDHAGMGASSTLGWFYYDELITGGYVNDNGTPKDSSDDTLRDDNNNGIADFHEDLYNVTAGRPNGRPYVGSEGPRCDKTFTFTRADGSVVELRDPDLLRGTCLPAATTSYRANQGPKRWNGGGGYPAEPTTGGVVGQRVIDIGNVMYSSSTDTNTMLRATAVPTAIDEYFSDRGLFPHIPNLLEPRHALNSNKGLGRLIFLATDDDDGNGQGARCPIPGVDTTVSSPTAECLQPRTGWIPLPDGGVTRSGYAWDRSTAVDGIPDYKASAFDDMGRLITGKDPTAAITRAEDQRKPMGRIEGEREIVFFLVAYVQQIYGPATDSCLITKPAPTGDPRQVQCDLWLHGDINVFFSKTRLNLDLHQLEGDIVVNDLDLATGWLRADTYNRLRTDPAYGGIQFTAGQTQDVPSINRRAAHTVVGAPQNNPLVWILGWEDQNSGGDRTYNDIVILINKQNNGSFRSDVVSDISPENLQDFTITEVTFTIDDNPYFVADGGASNPCSRPALDGGSGPMRPDIRYEVALDCKLCGTGCNPTDPSTYTVNPSPAWVTVPIEPSDGGPRNETEVLKEFLSEGRVGTQLCWRAIMESPGESCQPTINNINVHYKAQRSGQYGRASLIPMANTVIYGVHETPGRTWVVDGGVDQVSTRTFDRRPDTAERGHVYLKKIYEPGTLAEYDPADEVWDTGKWMRDRMAALENSPTGDPLNERRLLTMESDGGVVEVKTLMGPTDTTSPLFPDSYCSRLATPSRYADYDLNKRNGCDAADRVALRDWLYGWEDRGAATTREKMRTWPLGGVNLSTAAVIGPPSTPGMLLLSRDSASEQQLFNDRFKSLHQTRPTVTYVGTSQGYLHALKTGLFQPGDDPCTNSRVENQGYFGRTSGCGNDYGDGSELFAYLPQKLLPYYVENYRRTNDAFSVNRATMDATPMVADVDLLDNSYTATGGYNPATATGAWTPRTARNEGAKTVLASATGPRQSVFFALDVTHPASTTTYPIPLWELDIARDRFNNSGLPCTGASGGCNTLPSHFTGSAVKPDTSGSRHAPAIARVDFGANGGKKWIAMFATDFKPNAGTVGTVYLIDIKTGLPAQISSTSNIKSKLAGIVTLGGSTDVNEGIGGEPIPVDVDGDSNVDVIYVPSTSGKIYRINTAWSADNSSTNLGKVISSCVVADAKAVSGIANPTSQRIFSSISAQVVSSSGGKSVRLYFGTGNNPDVANEPEDASPRPTYHLMAFEDRTPLPTTRPGDSCPATLSWARPLGAGQVVWGGVTATKDAVFTTTAAGRAASVCDLDGATGGMIYAYSSAGVALPGNATPLDGHGTHAPLVYDGHMFFLNGAEVRVKGEGPFNNPTGAGATRKPRVLMWDVQSGTQIQKVVP